MAFFSVVIPLYNKENFVENTIKSVLNQHFTDFEILVVEDCSTDASLQMVQSIQSDKIKIIKHPHNKGLSASRNTGVQNALSDYICFLDADDQWETTFLEEIYHLILLFKNAHLFATNYIEYFSKSVQLLPNNGSKKLNNASIIDDFFTQSLSQPLYCPSSVCVKKIVFDSGFWFDQTILFGEDVDFNIRTNLNFKLAYSKNPLVKYFSDSENQITKSTLCGKKITDFDFYEKTYRNKNLKIYLDFNRYIMAKHYKLQRNWQQFHKMKNGIDLINLNYKQKFLLLSPRFVLLALTKFKKFLLLKKIRITAYD